ncbi:MAG: hypothetical protein PUD52_05215 [Prevotella sp.]|nr:hypothetical protein [Prevotella sp.]
MKPPNISCGKSEGDDLMPHCHLTTVGCHNYDSLAGDVWLVAIRHLVSFCTSLLCKHPTPYIFSQ